jgi:hypothetical protein
MLYETFPCADFLLIIPALKKNPFISFSKMTTAIPTLINGDETPEKNPKVVLNAIWCPFKSRGLLFFTFLTVFTIH